MKLVKWLLIALVGVFVVLMLLQTVASESGEVVVVTRTDTAGVETTTRLWVVDHEGAQWLRSADPSAGWSSALAAKSEEQLVVRMERDGGVATYTVFPVYGMGAEINQLMRDKYGWRDRIIRTLFGGDDATTVGFRLEPK